MGVPQFNQFLALSHPLIGPNVTPLDLLIRSPHEINLSSLMKYDKRTDLIK
jgi:hypothetical protein